MSQSFFTSDDFIFMYDPNDKNLYGKSFDLSEMWAKNANAKIEPLLEALEIALTYGLPPHDCSGAEQWKKAQDVLIKINGKP